ncbi:GNAT family N-acetyltransferase [Devosia sp. RR2S18]|uniref:GNAT family N-acetyltransferase n=1 Tax=Devosia rhizosphaerae TaxID=3049774 RepID=UPI002542319E|nr:GNAT family N-acetyltransferase [Devosia sp. RR2S18]WIJ27034.1 GNAT family N-acetyltransferase [Devosia sp. RR2S18]
MGPIIRSIQADDRGPWEALWRAYLTFYGAVQEPDAMELTWQRLLEPEEPVHGLVAELDGAIFGLVHFVYHRSTWTSGPCCYLQDLFTAEAARGQGVGTALIGAVCERAKADGANRVYWLTHESNDVARALYDKIAIRSGFIQYRRQL